MNRENVDTITSPLLYSKQEFDKRRKLFIQNVLPLSHQDVRQYLGEIIPADIVISKRFHHVIITLKCSKEIDYALEILPTRLLAGHEVYVELYPRRMMLYICGIPLHYTNDMYRSFLSSYGEVETAFLSHTSRGDCMGYGFVEFAHNRATLEQVQGRINGSTLECNTLYCGLVPDTILTYEDTISRTLYCVRPDNKPLAHPEFANVLQHTQHTFTIQNNRRLHVIECSDAADAESTWYYCRALLSSQCAHVGDVRYAMPAVCSKEIAHILNTTERKYPTVSNKLEIRHVLLEIFPNDPELVVSVEGLIAQLEHKLSSDDQQITPNVVMNLATLLKLSNPPVQVPDLSVPPPMFVNQAPAVANTNLHRAMIAVSQHKRWTESGRPVVEPGRPLTRSRMAVGSGRRSRPVQNDLLISNECSKRNKNVTQFIWESGDENQNTLPPAQKLTDQMLADETLPAQTLASSLWDEMSPAVSFSGPMTRQRRFTLEKALTPYYRKTPGAKSKKKERPVLFEADLNVALPDLFTRQRRNYSSTPKVLRRLLPEPEASPGSPRFIGQHSQGIGGHYADSYKPSKNSAAAS